MKKFFAIVLTLALALGIMSTIPVYATQAFDDVPADHWAFDYISEMVARGVLSGYPNGSFQPGKTITRAEFSTAMCLAAGLDPAAVDSTSYRDVDAADWYAPYVECGKDYLAGYVSDDGQPYYMPDAAALREDIAVALVKLKGYDASSYDESVLETTFTDYQTISLDARAYVAAAVEQGLISGYDDRTFRGQSTITRAEAATLLWKAYPDSNDTEPSTDVTPEPTQEPEKEYTYEVTTIAMVNEDVTTMVATDEGVYYIYQPKTVNSQGDATNQGGSKIYFTAKDGKGTMAALIAEALDWFDPAEGVFLPLGQFLKDEKTKMTTELYCLGVNHTNDHVYTVVVQSSDGVLNSGGNYIYDITENRVESIIESNPLETGFYESIYGGFRGGYLLSFDNAGGYKTSQKNDNKSQHTHNAYIDGKWIQFNASNILGVDGYAAPDDGEIFGFNATNFYLITQNNDFYRVDAEGNKELLFNIDDVKPADGKAFSSKSGEDMLMGFEFGTAAVSNDETFYFYDANYRCIRQIKRIDK